MATKKENDRVKKYDWAIFAQSYFFIARLACQELLSKKREKHSTNRNPNFPYKPADLYVSILFNIKHGMEVFIKALSVFACSEYDEGHDIRILFNNAKNKISKLKLKPRQKGFYDDVSENDIETSLKDLKRIEELILYFFQLDFLKQKLSSDFVINDTLNDVFRYPDNKASIRIDWGTVLSNRIQASDIQEIFTKLTELTVLLNKTGYLYAVLDRETQEDF